MNIYFPFDNMVMGAFVSLVTVFGLYAVVWMILGAASRVPNSKPLQKQIRRWRGVISISTAALALVVIFSTMQAYGPRVSLRTFNPENYERAPAGDIKDTSPKITTDSERIRQLRGLDAETDGRTSIKSD